MVSGAGPPVPGVLHGIQLGHFIQLLLSPLLQLKSPLDEGNKYILLVLAKLRPTPKRLEPRKLESKGQDQGAGGSTSAAAEPSRPGAGPKGKSGKAGRHQTQTAQSARLRPVLESLGNKALL